MSRREQPSFKQGVLISVVVVATLLQTTVADASNLAQVWYQGKSLPSGYAPRWDFASASYPPLGETVLFGGAPAALGDPWYNDTWIHSGTTGKWSRGPSAPAALTPRAGTAMAYDTVSQKIVMFGGSGPAWPPLNETWLFNGTKWTLGPAAPTALAGRTGAEMVYDDALGRIVLFGGSGTEPYNDTWTYDGSTNAWSKVQTATSPPARVFFGMTYDPTLGQVVMAGGDGSNDVWYFNGTRWKSGPSFTSDMGNLERVRLAYDPQLGGDVLFGGLGPGPANANTYLLADGAWSMITMHPSRKPSARLDPGMFWDSVNQDFVMFGGIQNSAGGATGFKDSWSILGPPVTISPTSGPPRTRISITSGPGWPSGESVDVSLGATSMGTTSADADGMVSSKITVPSTMKTGDQAVKLTSSSLGMVRQATFSVTSADSSTLSSPSSGSGETRPAPPASTGAGSTASKQGDRLHFAKTPAVASGQISAHDGQFWLGSGPVLLHGLNASPLVPDMLDSDYQQMQDWNMNFIRFRVRWSDFEPDAPIQSGSTWTHTYRTDVLARLKDQIAMAHDHGEYVMIENYCGPPCLDNGWPDWLYTKPYNSHGKDYTDPVKANTDYWTDSLQQQFASDWLSWLAGQLKGAHGIVGYELMNEPSQGTLPDSHTTTQAMLDALFPLAQAVRAADPTRVIFFMTRASSGAGIINADLSQFEGLGNMAVDVHDFFGGRWGGSLNLDPDSDKYGETLQSLFDFALTSTTPPYLGTVFGQTRFMDTYTSALAIKGNFPLFIGEFGGRGEDEPNVITLFATMCTGANIRGVSWAAWTYNGSNAIVKPDGTPEPWASTLASCAADTGEPAVAYGG